MGSVLDGGDRGLGKGGAAPVVHDQRQLVLLLRQREETVRRTLTLVFLAITSLDRRAKDGLEERPRAALERAGRDAPHVQRLLQQRHRQLVGGHDVLAH